MDIGKVEYTVEAKDLASTPMERVRQETAKLQQEAQKSAGGLGTMNNALGSMNDKLMAFSVAGFAAVGVVKQLWEQFTNFAAVEETTDVLDRLASQFDETAESMVKAAVEASGGLLSIAEATKTVASGLKNNLQPEQIYKLAEASAFLADINQDEVGPSFEKLVQAIGLGKEKSIEAAGGIIDLELAQTSLTQTMSETEKAAARYALFMENVGELQGRVGDTGESLADKLDKLGVMFKNAGLIIGEGFGRALFFLIGAMQGVGAIALGLAGAVMKLAAAVLDFVGAEELAKAATLEADKAFSDMFDLAEEGSKNIDTLMKGFEKASFDATKLAASVDKVKVSEVDRQKAVKDGVEKVKKIYGEWKQNLSELESLHSAAHQKMEAAEKSYRDVAMAAMKDVFDYQNFVAAQGIEKIRGQLKEVRSVADEAKKLSDATANRKNTAGGLSNDAREFEIAMKTPLAQVQERMTEVWGHFNLARESAGEAAIEDLNAMRSVITGPLKSALDAAGISLTQMIPQSGGETFFTLLAKNAQQFDEVLEDIENQAAIDLLVANVAKADAEFSNLITKGKEWEAIQADLSRRKEFADSLTGEDKIAALKQLQTERLKYSDAYVDSNLQEVSADDSKKAALAGVKALQDEIVAEHEKIKEARSADLENAKAYEIAVSTAMTNAAAQVEMLKGKIDELNAAMTDKGKLLIEVKTEAAEAALFNFDTYIKQIKDTKDITVSAEVNQAIADAERLKKAIDDIVPADIVTKTVIVEFKTKASPIMPFEEGMKRITAKFGDLPSGKDFTFRAKDSGAKTSSNFSAVINVAGGKGSDGRSIANQIDRELADLWKTKRSSLRRAAGG